MHTTNDFKQRDSVIFYSKSLPCVFIVFDCGFILGMSTDAFGILLGNVIYAVYIAVLSDKESESCSNGRKMRQDNTSGIVSC